MRKRLFILLLLPCFASAQYSYWYIASDGSFSDTVCLKNLTDSLFRKNNQTFTFIDRVFAKPFAGAVLPLGGTANQILKKTSDELDYTWASVDAAGGLSASNNLSELTNMATARSNLGLIIGTNVLAPNGSAASLTAFPTFNQNTTGTSSGWTTGRTLAITGDLAYTSPSINGTGNVTAAGTLATVNGNVGSFGSATQSGTFTVNAKGLITAASNTTIAIPQSAVTNLTSDLALKAPLASPTFTGTVSGITATMVGLGNVTNESKATMFSSPTFTGTVSGVTATMVGLGNVTNESKATMFTNPTFTGTVTLPNNAVTNAMLAGSIDASTKLINVLPYAIGGISASAATSATTGTMTVNMTSSTVTITPTGACTFNASGGVAGQILTFSITTSGTTSFTLTWGTNFRKTGTLATGTVSARFFTVTFICLNGTTWTEIARTAVQT